MITDQHTITEMLADRPRLSPQGIDQTIVALDNAEIMQRLNAAAQLARDAINRLSETEDKTAQMDALQAAVKHSIAVKNTLDDLATWTERAKHSWRIVGANAASISNQVYWNTPPDERTWIR